MPVIRAFFIVRLGFRSKFSLGHNVRAGRAISLYLVSFKTSVVGLGYLGATQAIILAKQGHSVIGVDTDSAKVLSLAAGKLPFFEPGLSELLKEMLETGRLRFTSGYGTELDEVDIHFLCVGTPSVANSEEVDLTAVLESTALIASFARADSVLVGRSTVPAGTADRLRKTASEVAGFDVRVAWNPEFLSEGTAVRDSLEPDRIVIGVDDTESEQILRQLYKPLTDAGVPLIVMDTRSAELVKVAANSFLAMKISFINGVAAVAEKVGASGKDISLALGLDKRIGPGFLRNGAGFGGGCLPKDIAGFHAQAVSVGSGDFAVLLGAAIEVNKSRRLRIVELSKEILGDLKGKKIVVLGAAFKPNTDDTRDSPGLTIAAALSEQGSTVLVHDPVVESLPQIDDYKLLHLTKEVDVAVSGSDLVIVATDWPEYKELDPKHFADKVTKKNLIDGRSILQPSLWTKAGWNVFTLGEGNLPVV
jgi:UDPglucose 6-dehydrogenase